MLDTNKSQIFFQISLDLFIVGFLLPYNTPYFDIIHVYYKNILIFLFLLNTNIYE